MADVIMEGTVQQIGNLYGLLALILIAVGTASRTFIKYKQAQEESEEKLSFDYDYAKIAVANFLSGAFVFNNMSPAVSGGNLPPVTVFLMTALAVGWYGNKGMSKIADNKKQEGIRIGGNK